MTLALWARPQQASQEGLAQEQSQGLRKEIRPCHVDPAVSTAQWAPHPREQTEAQQRSGARGHFVARPCAYLFRPLSLLGHLLCCLYPAAAMPTVPASFSLSWAESLLTKAAFGGSGFAVIFTSIIILNVNTEKTPAEFGHFNFTISLVEFNHFPLANVSTQVSAIWMPACSPSPKCTHMLWEPVPPLCPVPRGAALLGYSGPAWDGCTGLH